jgi:drug/metabolite transporter (DMT)-like permease
MAAPPRSEGSGAAGALLAAVGAVGFSGKAVLIKLAYAYPVDAVTLLALRMLMSLPFFVLMALLSGRNPGYSMERGDWGAILGLGFLGYYLASYLDFLGLQYISAGLERLILFLYPTMVLAISALALKLPVTRMHVAALALSYGGIVLVFADHVRLAGNVPETALGSLLVFGSALSYAIYLVWGGQVITRLGSARFTAYAMTVASALCIFAVCAHPSVVGASPSPAGLRLRIFDGGALHRAAGVGHERRHPPHRGEPRRAGGRPRAGFHHLFSESVSRRAHHRAPARGCGAGSGGRSAAQP